MRNGEKYYYIRDVGRGVSGLVKAVDMPPIKYAVVKVDDGYVAFGVFRIKRETFLVREIGDGKVLARLINYSRWAAPFSSLGSSDIYDMTPYAYLAKGDCFDRRYFKLWRSDEPTVDQAVYRMIDKTLNRY